MAKAGEVADIVSQAQFDYFAKQAKAAKGQGTPLDSRGQAHRASRDETGKIIKPGGGAPDRGPTGNEAEKAILAFYQNGGKRSHLPKESPTKNAARKDLEHAKMNKDKVVRPAVRPPGSSEFERTQMRTGGNTKPAKGRWVRYKGKYYYQTPSQHQRAINKRESLEYKSKTIDEDFDKLINKALGL